MALSFCLCICIVSSNSIAEKPSFSDIQTHINSGVDWSKSVRGKIALEYEDIKDEDLMRRELAEKLKNPALPPEARQALGRRDFRLSEECHRKEKRKYIFDWQAGRQKVEVEDHRDFQGLVAAGKLSGDVNSIARADNTSIILQDWNHFKGRLFWVNYKPSINRITLELLKPRERSVYDPPLGAGILPSKYTHLFQSNTASIEEKDEQIKMRYAAKDGISVEVILDSTDFRYRFVEHRDQQGQLNRRLYADDYRDVSGIKYPFKQIEEKWENNTKAQTTQIVVESASFGGEITDRDFSVVLPKTTLVFFLFNPNILNYPLDHDTVLTVNQLMQLFSELEKMLNAPEEMEVDAFQTLLAKIEKVGSTTKPGQ